MAKYKRTNLGYKPSKDVPVSSTSNEIEYPSFYVRKKLPIGKDAVGKSFDVKAKIKLVGLDQSTQSKGKESLDYRFEVINIAF